MPSPVKRSKFTALLCLWVVSGFPKSTVAGALNFFPQSRSMYKCERIGEDGEVIPDEIKEDDENSKEEDDGKGDLEKDNRKLAPSADAL